MAFHQSPNKDCVLAWEAMPDALLGALTPPQCDWLDTHLAGCDSCREQFAQQERLRRAMSLPVDLPIDMEANLQRLLSRIDNPDLSKPQDSLRPSRTAMRVLVAAVMLQAIGLGVMGAKLWSMDQSPAFRTLSQDEVALPSGSIRLVPDPGMKLADWDALLDAHGLRVVAGPNEVGGYTVVPQSEIARGESLVQRLRDTNGVLLAEPVADAP